MSDHILRFLGSVVMTALVTAAVYAWPDYAFKVVMLLFCTSPVAAILLALWFATETGEDSYG